MNKRRVTVTIQGRPYTFYSDDTDEYIAELQRRANEALRETRELSGRSSPVLTVLLLTDQLMRMETTKPEQPKMGKKEPGQKKEPKAKPGNGQVSMWDLIEE